MSFPAPLPDAGNAAFEVVDRQTASVAAISQIRALVVAGTLEPGQRLPSERELSQRLGLSRPTLREAVHALVAMGVLETRVGSGTFVTDLSPSLLARPLTFLLDANSAAVEDLLDVRLLLEVGAARWAAPKVGEPELERLRGHLDDQHRWLDDIERFVDGDVAFHHAIHEITGNELLLALMRSVAVLDRRARVLTSQSHEARADSLPEHARILEALATGDGPKAADAMHSHLTKCWAHMVRATREDGQRGSAHRTP